MSKRRQKSMAIDVQRLGRALAGPGLDTRMWVSAGTVGLLRDNKETGESEFFIPIIAEEVQKTHFTDAEGCIITVRLEPSEAIVNARWNGLSCGAFGSMLFPLKPGDEVLVLIPDGDISSPSVCIIACQSNAWAPLRSDDWDNDRVLFDFRLPVEIRGNSIQIKSGNLRLNGRLVRQGGTGTI